LNLFLAILLENFDEDSQEDKMQAPIRKLETKRLKNKISRKLTKNKTKISNFCCTFSAVRVTKLNPLQARLILDLQMARRS